MSFAGGLVERVSLLRREEARDALGGAAGEWRETALVWARARPLGSTRIEGGALRAMRRWELTVRPCDLRVGDRIERVDGQLLVLSVTRDPATPDRLAIEAEEIG